MIQSTHRSLLAAAAFAAAALVPACAFAQTATPQLPSNPNIVVDYIEPMDPARLNFDLDDSNLSREMKEKLVAIQKNYEILKDVRERLMTNRVLERFALFLTPLKLPTTLRLRGKQCDEANAYYNRTDTSITLCYEYVALFESRAPKETTAQGITRDDAIIGAVVSTLLHETGHALFSIYQIPILGREEDGADQLAGFVMLQFGKEIAKTTIKGAAWKWANQDWSNPAYHGVHSTPQTRFYNFLCMGYGADPNTFRQFIEIGWLPKWRAPLCANEYEQAKRAFEATILPNLDTDLAERVQKITWIETATVPATRATGPGTPASPTSTTRTGRGTQGGARDTPQ